MSRKGCFILDWPFPSVFSKPLSLYKFNLSKILIHWCGLFLWGDMNKGLFIQIGPQQRPEKRFQPGLAWQAKERFSQEHGWSVTHRNTANSRELCHRRAYPSMDDSSHKLPPWNSPASYRQLHRTLSSPRRFCLALITLGREGPCEFCDFLCLVNLLSFPGLMNTLQFIGNSYIA